MRHWINLCESQLPQVVYHGTSDLQWNMAQTGVLYLTTSRDEAENYADEAVISDYPEGTDHDKNPPLPSQAIIVEFQLQDIVACGHPLRPDWGWDQATSETTWEESLKAVGSFCVDKFSQHDKAMGNITPAF